jgi:hypothetical protein
MHFFFKNKKAMDSISFTRLSNQQKALREALRVKESYPRKVFNNDTEFINVHYSFRFEDLCDQLTEQFEVERAVCEADTQELLVQLFQKKIIRVVE